MMTRTILIRTAAVAVLAGIGMGVPAEAWAGIIEQVDVTGGYYQEIASVAAILGALWIVDTVTWPYLTGQD